MKLIEIKIDLTLLVNELIDGGFLDLKQGPFPGKKDFFVIGF